MVIPPVGEKELALLKHVLQSSARGNPEAVLQAIDSFCWSGNWMMHVGDVKGQVLDAAVASAQPIKTALELGSYCGYSAVRVARLLPPGAKLIGIDPSEVPEKVAAPILEHAGLRDRVELLHGTAAEVLPTLAARGVVFDFVLIDHDKERYLSDLQKLEALGLMRRGTVVVADNILVFKKDDYLTYVRDSGKYSSSELHESHVEYKQDTRDGVEVSVYAC